MKSLRHHRAARRELIVATKRYQREGDALAARFLDEIDRAMNSIEREPHRVRPGLHGTHFVRVESFPHRIVFVEVPSAYFVVAVEHTHRRPGYWRRRLRDL